LPPRSRSQNLSQNLIIAILHANGQCYRGSLKSEAPRLKSLSFRGHRTVEIWGSLVEYWFMAGMYCLNDLLKLVESEQAEELRLEPGSSPEMAVGGRIRVLDLPR